MAYLLSNERPAAGAKPLRSLRLVSRWFAAWRAARARRLALATLLEMNEARLVDLGIERQDVFLAIKDAQPDIGELLGAARNTRRRSGL